MGATASTLITLCSLAHSSAVQAWSQGTMFLVRAMALIVTVHLRTNVLVVWQPRESNHETKATVTTNRLPVPELVAVFPSFRCPTWQQHHAEP